MNDNQIITTVTVEAPRCSLIYSEAPCTAALGVTGDIKCYNTPETCQDPPNYDPIVQKVNFKDSSEKTPAEREVEGTAAEDDFLSFPLLRKVVSKGAQEIDPGNSLGRRTRIVIEFENGQTDDVFFDKYLADRNFNPWEVGSFWGKWIARYPNVKGYKVTITKRKPGVAFDSPDAEKEIYFASDGTLDRRTGVYKLTAKDPLEFVEGKKFLFPQPNNGALSTDITDTATAITLTPIGIGDAEYPASGFINVGEEVIAFTRTGDDLSLTERGAFNSEIDDHSADDTAQVVGDINGRADQILAELLGKTNLDPSFFGSAIQDKWLTELEASGQTQIFQAFEAEPTEIHKWIGSLMRDVGLNIYSDVDEIKMRTIRNVPSTFFVDDGIMQDIKPSVNSSDVLSAVFIRYGRINPAEKIDEGKNYVGHLISFTQDENVILMNNTPEIKDTFSRFIISTNRQSASRSAEIFLQSRERPVRELEFDLPRTVPFVGKRLGLAQIGQVETAAFEDSQGFPVKFQAQVVRLTRKQGFDSILLREYLVRQSFSDTGVRIISLPSIEGGYRNINLRTLHDETWPGEIPPETIVRFVADPGVVFGSDATSILEASVDTGEWPEIDGSTTTVELELVDMTILGRGGNGGSDNGNFNFSTGDVKGKAGGRGLTARATLKLVSSFVGGGGGGGGAGVFDDGTIRNAGGGGGGAGRLPGLNGGDAAKDGTDFLGGDGTIAFTFTPAGGDGGDIGQPGMESSTGEPGGSAGVAIDGFSLVTVDANSTVAGPTQN